MKVTKGGKNMNNEVLYQSRLGRIRKAINFEPVDRVPVVFMGTAFAPRWMGITLAQYSADPALARDTILAAMERLGDLDGVNLVPGLPPISLSGVWLSKVAIPGRDLPDDSLWQLQEAEVMSVDDYDVILEQGFEKFLASHLPKIVDVKELGAAREWVMANIPRTVELYRQRGFVVVSGLGGMIPFELLCGARSMSQFYFDLYRRPDKVQATMDAMMPGLIKQAVAITKAGGTIGGWVGGFRSASGLISQKYWERFAFPYFQQMINALAENDLVSVLHWDQNWTRDLGRLKDLPAKMCLLNPDGMTDLRKMRELLGDHMAVMGDVPSQLFAAGTPDDIYNYVRDLVRDIGPTGLILCPGCDAPINTKPENMEAFVAASREFGMATA
ncbi:MAG: hypothetical protein NT159_08100 [Proteobacteria bacterium]|nr:hypothetical protein [Pseudomonadota bacterium]